MRTLVLRHTSVYSKSEPLVIYIHRDYGELWFYCNIIITTRSLLCQERLQTTTQSGRKHDLQIASIHNTLTSSLLGTCVLARSPQRRAHPSCLLTQHNEALLCFVRWQQSPSHKIITFRGNSPPARRLPRHTLSQEETGINIRIPVADWGNEIDLAAWLCLTAPFSPLYLIACKPSYKFENDVHRSISWSLRLSQARGWL